MPTYDAELDSAAENTSHALMLQMVGPDRRVLDVGCATGYLGEAIAARGCRVSGVELDPEAASRAQKVLDEVLVADLETADLVEHFGPGSFDVVVLGDVLEHLRDPGRLLRNAVGLLADKGSIVISIPNVAHAALRLALLQGRWTYSDRGLLDRTHVQFFTRASLLALLRDCGLVAVDLRGTTAPPFGTEIEIDPSALPDGVVAWVEQQPDADVYQFVVRAVRDDADGAVEVLRRRYDAAREDLRRATAELAARSGEGGPEWENERLARELGLARAEAEEARRRAEEAEAGLAALTGTVTLRLLQRPRQWYAAVRRWGRSGR